MDTPPTLASGRARASLIRPFAMPHDRALRVGLTGGIGSGKSTLARAFRGLGAVSIDADALAHDVVAPGTPALAAIREAFGSSVIDEGGALDRPALGSIVFADPEARRRLERITHPAIAAAAAAIMDAAPADAVCVYDVPLLVEKHMAPQFDVVVVVDAPMALRLDRLVDRGMDRDDALHRISAQATDEERRAVAHIWVDNDGTVGDLTKLGGLIWADWLDQPPSSGVVSGD